MIQARTSVRLLKYLGIVLVILPEPVTTVFGVALLFAANYLSQKLEAGLVNFLLETPGYHSYWFKHSGDYADGESGQTQRYRRDDIVYHTIDMPMLYRRYGIRSDGSRVKPRDSRPEFASGSDKNLVYHTIDMPMLYRRYGMASRH